MSEPAPESTSVEEPETIPRAWWISWYHDPRDGEFELHSPWWISGFTMDKPSRDIIVAAVQAPDEDAAWDVVKYAYDRTPTRLEERFIEELEDRERAPSARQPWTDETGRFQHSEWMVWSVHEGYPEG